MGTVISLLLINYTNYGYAKLVKQNMTIHTYTETQLCNLTVSVTKSEFTYQCHELLISRYTLISLMGQTFGGMRERPVTLGRFPWHVRM